MLMNMVLGGTVFMLAPVLLDYVRHAVLPQQLPAEGEGARLMPKPL
jgi:hypothetical protein